MNVIQVIVFFLLCAMVLAWFARRAGVPYPIALVLGGGALGFVPGLPQLEFDPQFLLVLVLPPILYQAALLTSWRDFRANMGTIGLLAFGLVFATTLIVGLALKMVVPSIPWAAAFVFGAIVSPPDAVAATAILSRLNMPRRLVTVLEGESLVNDASGLVLYKFAVAAVLTGAFSMARATGDFVLVSVGGTLVGIALGLVFVRVHRYIGDSFIEVLLSLSVPYTAYVLAESFHLSGVLAVVAAGLVRGRYSPEIVSAEMRILARSVWNILVFLLNSLIFILIGTQLSGTVARLSGYGTWDLFGAAIWISLVAILVRFAWVYVASYVPLWLRGKSGGKQVRGEAFIMSWCGMRGIVSLAAALALPEIIQTGAPFPHRDLIIFLTFVVIAVTLVLQGLTLSPLIRSLRVGGDSSVIEEQARARRALGVAALFAIDEVAEGRDDQSEVARRVRAEFNDRMHSDAPHARDPGTPVGFARELRLAAVRAERRELIRIWRAGEISDDVLHQIEEELDYEESRL